MITTSAFVGKCRVTVADDDSGSGLRQGFCAGITDATASAGHKGDAVIQLEQIEIHGFCYSIIEHMLSC